MRCGIYFLEITLMIYKYIIYVNTYKVRLLVSEKKKIIEVKHVYLDVCSIESNYFPTKKKNTIIKNVLFIN